MKREDFSELSAFLAVADARSFTRAAAKLGMSQSALSHTIRRLEERLGFRLLTRTTRSVAPTDAGERLIETLRPAFDDIDEKLTSLSRLRDKPSGTIRITTSEHPAKTILWPALKKLMRQYPDINAEIEISSGLTDIVTQRFDAGVRLGEQVAKDMIAVRIGPDLRMAAIGSPSYFSEHAAPKMPQDLAHHQCINLRLPTAGGLYAWELEKRGRDLRVRVEGRLVLNNAAMVVEAAISGFGIAFLPEDYVIDYVRKGQLVRVLEDWCDPFAGYHLYYPSRRQLSPALAVLIEKLRYRA